MHFFQSVQGINDAEEKIYTCRVVRNPKNIDRKSELSFFKNGKTWWKLILCILPTCTAVAELPGSDLAVLAHRNLFLISPK